MNTNTRAVLLSLIVMAQALTLIGGYIADKQISGDLVRWQDEYYDLYEETHPEDPVVILGSPPDPFAPLGLLAFFGLLLTVVVFVDQIRHMNAEDSDVEAK